MNASEQAEIARQEYFETRYANVKPTVTAHLAKQDVLDPNEANAHSISKHLTEHHQMASDQTIQQAIRALGSSLAPKPAPVPLEGQALRDDLEATIMQLLVASPAERERERQSYHARLSLSREEIQTKKHSGPYLVTTEAMMRRLVDLRESKRLRGLSHEELQREVASKKTTFQFESLPDHFTPFNISSMSASAWKEAVRKYGLDQLNRRIQQQVNKGEWSGVPIVGKSAVNRRQNERL